MRSGRATLADLTRPAGVFLASRVVVLLAMCTGSVMASAGGRHLTVKDQFHAWDGAFYLDIAKRGYPRHLPVIGGHVLSSRAAFFPLLPLLIRVVKKVTGLSPLQAGVLLGLLFGLAACCLLWALTRRLFDAEAADRATALFAFFPASFVLGMPYAEGLMLVLAIGCLWCLIERRFLPAGVLAALATATRPNAVVLVVCVLFEAVLVMRSRRRLDGRALLAVVLAPLGFVAFMLFLWHHTGTLNAWFRTQREGWHESLALTATVTKVQHFLHNPFHDVNTFLAVTGFFFIIVAGVLVLRSGQPGVLVLYTAGVVALALLSRTLGARPRFVLTAFPLFIALGQRLRRPLPFIVVLGMFAALLGTLTVVSLSTTIATP